MRGIYAVLNTANGKMYIGSAKNIEVRWQQHRYMLRTGTHHSMYLQRAWDKYGEDSFILQVLEYVEQKADLKAAEQRWINFYGGGIVGRDNYNAHPIAVGGRLPGWVPPPEAIAKLCAASRGERNPKARLTETQVREIHARFVAGETIYQLAATYDVGSSTVYNIVAIKTWKHLGLPRFNMLAETGKLRRHYRLTLADVATIKKRLECGESQTALAREYGVSSGTISNIATGRRKMFE